MLPRPKRNAVERAEKEENKLIALNTNQNQNQNQNPLSCHWRSLTQSTQFAPGSTHGRITNSSLFTPESAH
eukprot:scaffold343625_cov28-Attheya_sp.AAC.1